MLPPLVILFDIVDEMPLHNDSELVEMLIVGVTGLLTLIVSTFDVSAKPDAVHLEKHL